MRWLPGWIERDKNEQRQILSELVQRERWVMDGTGASTFDIRLPRTDLVLWVRVPRRVALLGLATRVLKNYGKTRPDMAAGCAEMLPDNEFLNYIWNFEKRTAPKVIDAIHRYGPDIPVCELRSRRQINELINHMINV